MTRMLAERRAAEEAAKPAKPMTLSETLEAQRNGTWVDPDAGRRDAVPAYRPPRL